MEPAGIWFLVTRKRPLAFDCSTERLREERYSLEDIRWSLKKIVFLQLKRYS